MGMNVQRRYPAEAAAQGDHSEGQQLVTKAAAKEFESKDAMARRVENTGAGRRQLFASNNVGQVKSKKWFKHSKMHCSKSMYGRKYTSLAAAENACNR